MKLNSIPSSVFQAVDTRDSQIKVNSGEKSRTLSRQNIIATGRLVACEAIGANLNRNARIIDKYESKLNAMGTDYATLARAHKEKKLLFCAAQACKQTGEDAPATFEEFKARQLSFAQNDIFLKTMAAIDRDVLQPIFMDVMSSVGMDLMRWEALSFGSTKEIEIRSNNVFMLEDSAWGSGRSTTKNYLYKKSITLNPTMRSCNVTIKWYQDIVNGDAGEYYAAIMRSYYSKIYALLIQAMNAAVAGGKYIPAGLTYPTYSTANWLKATDKLAAVNGVDVSDLMAIGTRSALSNLLPVDGNGGALTGLQYGLGEQWFTNGYLPKAGQVDLFPVTPAIVPGTQNSTIDTIDTGNNIYILAKAGRGYAPLIGGYYEGTPITLTATPGGTGNAYGTADFTIDINFGATIDVKPVFASKVAVVTSVYGS